MRSLTVLLLVVPLLAFGQPQDEARWRRAVGVLQYLEGDYPEAQASQDAAELAEQAGLADEVVKALDAIGPDAAPYLSRAQALRQSIGAGAPGPEVSAACAGLARALIQDQGLTQAPKASPSLEHGAKVFAQSCATCHGATGEGNGPAGLALTPKPANFHDGVRMGRLSPFRVFTTTATGIPNTPMPPFPQLSDEDRWAVAFYVFSLRQPACEAAPKSALGLEALATTSDAVLGERYGNKALACYRTKLPATEKASTLAVAVAGVERARQLAREGHTDDARQAVVDAYLSGVEPVEPMLRARDPELVAQLESAFTRARLAAENGREFDREAQGVLASLERAKGAGASGFWSVFFAALLILLREGFEAVVVVGALLAVLKKLGAVTLSRVVHAGWSSALVVGAVLFVLGQQLFAGANREWMETLVSLGAVGLLLYAALWLNARATLSQSMTALRGKAMAAVSEGSAVGLFTIAFTSAGRESVEAALFLQGLASDSKAGASWGALAGLVALLALVAMVRRVGFVLPMKTLFNASTVLLVVTAVALLGKGLHGLQELGILGLHPMPFVLVEPLGIFPDATSLVPQLALALVPLAWWWSQRQRALSARTVAPGTTSPQA
jgi:high-affinity iron transporter